MRSPFWMSYFAAPCLSGSIMMLMSQPNFGSDSSYVCPWCLFSFWREMILSICDSGMSKTRIGVFFESPFLAQKPL